MASKSNVLLGFDDEVITEKHTSIVNFTTNKIGGKPDYPPNINVESPICPLCQLPRLLIVQIYAPLDNSPYHRVLYLFACLNPNCWNHNESWYCIRVQSLVEAEESSDKSQDLKFSTLNATDWCQDANDWGDSNISNANEENGNIVENFEKFSDDESCSTEESLKTAFGNMIVDDRNANTEMVYGDQGAVAENRHSSPISAEIEGEEGENVTIDTPTIPQKDLRSLLQEVCPLPQQIQRHGVKVLQFVPHFISVSEEQINNSYISDHHVRELLSEYQQHNQEEFHTTLKNSSSTKFNENNEIASEKYEKSLPAHGDRMFYHFLSKIQMNPGQILRYGRERDHPLLIQPLQDHPKTCSNCGGPKIFEFQVLSTIIQKLRLSTDSKNCARLEFGTVLIFTCKNSCWSTSDNFIEENVLLQLEKY